MYDNLAEDYTISMHTVAERLNWHGHSVTLPEHPFRVSDLSLDLEDVLPDGSGDITALTVDHLWFKRSFDNAQLTVGRQPIDWGAGRLWQPHNVFGSFLPTALDTEFKTGVDAALFDYYVDDFSFLSVAVVGNNQAFDVSDVSVAARYQSLIGTESELSVLVGDVLDTDVFGLGFETALNGIGFRVESSVSRDQQDAISSLVVSGIDYQFDNGVLAILEWRYQDRDDVFAPSAFSSGSDQLNVRNLFGLLLNKDITPLLNGAYLFLHATDGGDFTHSSSLHQVNLTYSMSDESLLLLSLLTSTGSSDANNALPESLYGGLGNSLSVNYRVYF